MITETFVYKWTDNKTGKMYIGSHKGSKEDGYICSSKLMMEQYKDRPKDFSREVIAEGNFEDIRLLEVELLNAVDARANTCYYNQHNGTGNWYIKQHTEKTKQKMRKPKSKEHRVKFLGNKNASYKHTPEQIEEMRQRNIGRKNSKQALMNLKQGQINRYCDPNQRIVQSIAAKNGWETRRKNINDQQ
jgi:hypothetical protein